MITIGIPTLNGPSRLRRCLTSLHDSGGLANTRVLVCDDGSSEANLRENKDVIHQFSGRLPGLEMLMHTERKGIAKGWNDLTRHFSDAEIVVLINDDIEVVPHWIEVLEFSVRENPHLGMVGLNSYVSLTKETEALYRPGVPEHVRKPRIDYAEAHLEDGGGRLLFAPGAIFAFRRRDFDQVGGFDERYKVYYEEVDFGVSLRRHLNLRSAVATYPIVYHMGGATMSDPALNASAELLKSRILFQTKWGKDISQLRAEICPTEDGLTYNEWNTQLHYHKE